MTDEITLTDEQKKLIEDNKWDEDAVMAYLELGIGDDDLSDFEESYQGKYSSDEEFARETAENLGELPRSNVTWPLYCIDWEYAARDIMMDYSKQDGFYFRNL